MYQESAAWLDRSRVLLSRLPIKSRETHRNTAFTFFPSQRRRFAMMREQWQKYGLIRIIDLKARRVGFSSQTDGLYWARGLGFTNQNMKILAHLQTSADELFRVAGDLSRGFPGFPLTDIQAKRIRFKHKGGDSYLSIGTAGTPSAGRGGTLSALHLSEAAKYLDPEIFVAMISSVGKGPGSMIVIESTANGREGPGEAFYTYWEDAIAGKNGYIPNFASWLEDPAFTRPAEEAEDAPADDLEKELMSPPFNASREQIAWMRRTKADDCRNIEAKFLEDYPHCPQVAFQISGQPAFPRDELAYAESTIKPPIRRGYFRRLGGTNFKFVADAQGPWHLWRFPFDKNGRGDGKKYYTAADAALGEEDGDFAAIVILCGETGELAARFAEHVPPEELANQIDMASRYFSLALVNIELTGNLGRWALSKLRDTFRYPNMYMWKGRDDKKRGKSKSSSIGFEMNNATRRMVIDACRSGLRMGLRDEPGALIVNDRALMSQLGLFTLKEWRWDVRRGHDDIALAYFIACLTREQYPPPHMDFTPKQTMHEENPLNELNIHKPTEMDLIFMNEMRRVRQAAGINKAGRGLGRRAMNRLAGI
jgi:hypothetical protein